MRKKVVEFEFSFLSVVGRNKLEYGSNDVLCNSTIELKGLASKFRPFPHKLNNWGPTLRHKTRVNQQSFCTHRGPAVALIATVSLHTIYVFLSQLGKRFPISCLTTARNLPLLSQTI